MKEETSIRRCLLSGLQSAGLLALFMLPLLGEGLIWHAPNPEMEVVGKSQFDAYFWIIGQAQYFDLISFFFRLGAFLSILLFFLWALDRMRLGAVWSHLLAGGSLPAASVLLTVTGVTLAWLWFLLQASLLVAPEGVAAFLAVMTREAFLLFQTLTLLVLAVLVWAAVGQASLLVRSWLRARRGQGKGPHPRALTLCLGLGLSGTASLVLVALDWTARGLRPQRLDWGLTDLAFRYLSPVAMVWIGLGLALVLGMLLGALLHVFMPRGVNAAQGAWGRLAAFLVVAGALLVLWLPLDRLLLLGHYDMGASLKAKLGMPLGPAPDLTAVIMEGGTPGARVVVVPPGPGGLSSPGQAGILRFLAGQTHTTALTLPALNYLVQDRLRAWDKDGALKLAWRATRTGLGTALDVRVFGHLLAVTQPQPYYQNYLQVLSDDGLYVRVGYGPLLEMGALCLRYGFAPQAEEWFGRAREAGASSAQVEDAIRDAATPPNGRLSGRIRLDGRPLEGVRVRLFRGGEAVAGLQSQEVLARNLIFESVRSIRENLEFSWRGLGASDAAARLLATGLPDAVAVTDKNGAFSFTRLDPGMYAVGVLLPGTHPQVRVRHAPGVISISEATPEAELGEIEIFSGGVPGE